MRIFCTGCGNTIMYEDEGGKDVILGRFMYIEKGKAFSRCKDCKTDIEIPIQRRPTGKKKVISFKKTG